MGQICFVAIPLLKLSKLISFVEQFQNKSWIPDTNVWFIVCKETMSTYKAGHLMMQMHMT